MKKLTIYLKNNLISLLITAPFFILCFMFLLLPAINLIKGSFTDIDGKFVGLSNYYAVITRRYYQISIINSLSISLISSIAGIIMGILTSYVLFRVSEKSRNIFLIFTNITSNFAGIPLAFGYIILLGTNGILTTFILKQLGIDIYQSFSLYSVTGVAIAYLYFQMPLATLLIYPSFFGIRKEWHEASLNLGASEFYFWRTVGIPILTPGIIAAFVILFANALGAYVTPQALTNGTFNIITLRLAHFLTSEVNPDYNKADALAVILGGLLTLSLIINLRMNKRIQLWQK